MVTGFERGFYVVYTLDVETRKHIVDYEGVEVFPDHEYIDNILYPKLLEFKEMVDTRTPPPLTSKEIKRLNKSLTPKKERKPRKSKKSVAQV